MWRRLARTLLRWLRHLDAESVDTFQSMYYVTFAVAAVSLIFLPDFNVQYVDVTLGRYYYDAWLAVNLICPPLTLIGRRVSTLAARSAPGEPNSAYGAAWLQLCGDTGVWGNVLVYFASMLLTGWWMKEIYVFSFILMGVCGGAMFTVRSIRRLVQIDRRAKEKGWTA